MHPNHGSSASGSRGHWHGHGFSHHGGRARRGDVPVAVMALLKERDMHGYQIIQELAERTGGVWTPSPGSIYPALQLLEEQGMLSSEHAGGKRVFALTELGRKHADMIPEGSPWSDIAQESDPARRLRESFSSLMGAVTQIGRAGSPEQIERTAGILSDARKQVYTMLAGDE